MDAKQRQRKPLLAKHKLFKHWTIKQYGTSPELNDIAVAFCQLLDYRDTMLRCYGVATMEALIPVISQMHYLKLAEFTVEYVTLRHRYINRGGW
jgi:hypothetical protein